MKNNTIIMSDLRYIDDDVFSEIESYTINSSDLYLTIAGTIGAVGIVPETVNGMNLTENAAKLTNISCDKMYLMYSLLSTIAQEHFSSRFHQVAQPKLSIETASKTPIPLPPIEEQERVVVEIEKWLALIETIESGKADLRTTIKQAKSKILDLAIHGKLVPQDPNDEPASELLKRINPKAEITCDNGQYQNMPFELPNTWVCCRLGDVISIKSGDSISVRNNRKGEYPIYGGNGINGYFCDYNVESDTIVIGRVGFYCGSVYKTKSRAWVTDNAFIVCYKNIFNSTYLKHLLEWLQLSKTSNSTAQPVISGKGIYPILIPLPPLAEQQRIVDAIDKAFAKLDAIMESL